MKIIDQNMQLASQRFASNHRETSRVHETFVNGQLATRETANLSIKNSSLSLNQLQVGNNSDWKAVNQR
ncbi:MAG: hypothetical protein R3254_12195, partial [Thiomicrorhabdus sp.]|nr:hypothetical protein [Thiomicrorhabdus sp.]